MSDKSKKRKYEMRFLNGDFIIKGKKPSKPTWPYVKLKWRKNKYFCLYISVHFIDAD